MTKNPLHLDFVRDAVREKAARELVTLNQRADAFGSVERARDALFTLTTDLANSAAAMAAVASDATVVPRMKKLRKLVDDAHLLATELADSLGADKNRATVEAQREVIHEALRAVGLDPAAPLTPPDEPKKPAG